MADRIWESIPANLRNMVLLIVVGAGGLGGGGSFMGYVNAQNPKSAETHTVILEIAADIQGIKTDMAIVKNDVADNKEAGRINTEDIKKLLSK